MSGMSVAAKNIVREIACMSYGSREGTKGGRGNLGLLKMSNGDFRIIKFNTHGEKSGGAAAIASSDNLRSLLHALSLEVNLDVNTRTRINHLLQVTPEGAPRQGAKLLDRTITATVVELIAGKGIWKEVLAAYRKDKYTSASRTDFDSVKGGDGLVNTANARTLKGVEKYDKGKIAVFRETAKQWCYTRIGEDYGEVCALMSRVIPEDGAFTKKLAEMNCSSAELTNLMGRCALRLAALKYRVNHNHTAEETAAYVTGLLGKCAPGSTAGDVLTDLEGVLKFCVDNGEGEDNEALLISCLQEMMLAELTGIGASDDIHTTQVVFKGEVRDFTGSANALKALKTVLRKSEEQPEDVSLSKEVTAYENMEMFARAAGEHQEAGDFYVRLSADGTRLESAGRRNILRGSASEAENNRVRDFLRDCVIAYYGSEANIPAEVKAQMTNFNGGGHPLSAKRIGLIWNAIQLDRIGKMRPDELRDDPYVARTLMRNGRQFQCRDATINGWRRFFPSWATEKDPEFFREDCEKNVRPKVFYECIRTLHKELGPGGDGRPFEKDFLRTSSFSYGSKLRVSYQDIRGKSRTSEVRLQRRAENDIASFVTGGKVRDFRKLDHGQRNLALFLKASLNQELAYLSAYGVHDRNENEFTFARNNDTAVQHCSVDFTSDGGLVFRYVQAIEIRGVTFKGSDDFMKLFEPADGKSRKYYEELTVSYSKEEVENITKADFEALERTFQQFGKKKNDQRDDATIEKDVREHLPKEFLVNPKVELNYAFDID